MRRYLPLTISLIVLASARLCYGYGGWQSLDLDDMLAAVLPSYLKILCLECVLPYLIASYWMEHVQSPVAPMVVLLIWTLERVFWPEILAMGAYGPGHFVAEQIGIAHLTFPVLLFIKGCVTKRERSGGAAPSHVDATAVAIEEKEERGPTNAGDG